MKCLNQLHCVYLKKMVYFNPIFQHLGWSVVESDNSPTVCELTEELIGELFVEDLLKSAIIWNF